MATARTKKEAGQLAAKACLTALAKNNDPKVQTRLRELTQSMGLGAPRYELLNARGKDNDRLFTMGAFLPGRPPFMATARTKKEASQLAAKACLTALAKDNEPKDQAAKDASLLIEAKKKALLTAAGESEPEAAGPLDDAKAKAALLAAEPSKALTKKTKKTKAPVLGEGA
jgi:hypothetical protein